MIYALIGSIALAVVVIVVYDVHKNRNATYYSYLPAPTIGSVRPPALQEIGPVSLFGLG